MTMRRLFSLAWVGLSCLALLAPGCGKDPFGPPSRPLPPPIIEAGSSKPAFLVYVVPGPPTGDFEFWGGRAQYEANNRKAIFRIMGPSPAESQAQQPEVVRRAVAEGASALIVSPGDSPELPKALAEAESKGVPVVLIGKSVAAPEGSKPFTRVDLGSVKEPAKQVVAATIEDLKKEGRPINGTAILLVDRKSDDHTARRVSALRLAAEAAKFRQVIEVPFDGSAQDSAKLAVIEAIKANPDVSVVLADEAEGLKGASLARQEVRGKPIFFVGGYTEYRTSPINSPPPHESAYVDGKYAELGSLAVTRALARLKGEAAGETALVMPRFARTEAQTSSEEGGKPSLPVTKKPENEPLNKALAPPRTGGINPQ